MRDEDSTGSGGLVDLAVRAGMALIVILVLGYPVYWVFDSVASEFGMSVELPAGMSWAGVCFLGGLILLVFPFAFIAALIPAMPIIILLLLVIANNTSDGKISEAFGMVVVTFVYAGGALIVLSIPVWIVEQIVGWFG